MNNDLTQLSGMPHVLVVDDDRRLRSLLKDYLSENGFLVSASESAGDARTKMKYFGFDILVVDVMMEGETGIEFMQTLRSCDDIPILLLTAMGESEDRIRGLASGADDYLAKPFEPQELVLRLQAILRRATASRGLFSGKIVFGDLVRETLASRAGIEARTVDVQIARLRRKIEHNPRLPQFLSTVRGEGYVLREG